MFVAELSILLIGLKGRLQLRNRVGMHVYKKEIHH